MVSVGKHGVGSMIMAHARTEEESERKRIHTTTSDPGFTRPLVVCIMSGLSDAALRKITTSIGTLHRLKNQDHYLTLLLSVLAGDLEVLVEFNDMPSVY